MREILFRGKRKDTGEWVEGDLVRLKDGTKAIPHIYGYGEVIPDTVGQFTGVTDRSGKKIFEGDIVQDGYLFGKVVFATAQDGFDGMAGFMVDDIDDGLQNYNGFWHEVKVLGNIHDNPELLEGDRDGN